MAGVGTPRLGINCTQILSTARFSYSYLLTREQQTQRREEDSMADRRLRSSGPAVVQDQAQPAVVEDQAQPAVVEDQVQPGGSRSGIQRGGTRGRTGRARGGRGGRGGRTTYLRDGRVELQEAAAIVGRPIPLDEPFLLPGGVEDPPRRRRIIPTFCKSVK